MTFVYLFNARKNHGGVRVPRVAALLITRYLHTYDYTDRADDIMSSS